MSGLAQALVLLALLPLVYLIGLFIGRAAARLFVLWLFYRHG